jgi:hypothetical protein
MPSQYRDVEILRENYIDACKKRGFAVVVRKLFTPDDVDNHYTTRCSTCYDTVYKEAGVFACPVCFGTSFTGGYWQPVFSWGDLSDRGGHNVVEKPGAGRFEKEAGAASISYTPIVHEGDLVWQVSSYDSGGALTVLDLHQISGGVIHNTIKGRLSGKQKGATDETAPTLIYQTFDHVLVPEGDIRQSISFRQ